MREEVFFDQSFEEAQAQCPHNHPPQGSAGADFAFDQGERLNCLGGPKQLFSSNLAAIKLLKMKGVLTSFIPPPFEFRSFHFFPPRGPLSLRLRERANQEIVCVGTRSESSRV